MKSREQKLADMAKELRRELPSVGPVATDKWAETMAGRLLDAAEREEPAWPTNTSRQAFFDGYAESTARPTATTFNTQATQDGLRAAFLADPIIQQVIALSHTSWDHGETANGLARLLRTARDAGLLDGTEGK